MAKSMLGKERMQGKDIGNDHILDTAQKFCFQRLSSSMVIPLSLRVKNIWYEPGVRQTKKLLNALDGSIQRFAKFNECDQISTS